MREHEASVKFSDAYSGPIVLDSIANGLDVINIQHLIKPITGWRESVKIGYFVVAYSRH